eukprot:TRINITY_DN57537_c0_g1_i1.p2 TRINITY_DN57537_c0_g1~~TRINITY_DN57537_c0_g1_i1.p2  ORF type:complete len:123 (+),score=57.57 TRINITY_DN57537_c0_g1_i1:73-441(+)
MAADSTAFIQQLLDAEKKAEAIIADAKKHRLQKSRQAKEKAEEELQSLKKEQEAKFQKETGVKASTDHSAQLKDATRAGIEEVHQDYKTNKDAAIKYICGKVLDVSIDISDTQMMALKMGIA